MKKKEKQTYQKNLFCEELFEQYKKVFKETSKRLGKSISRNLRLFDIKFRLVLGINVDFDPAIAYTKTPETRNTYISLVKLVELWNAYEVFLIYTGEQCGNNSKYSIIKDKKANTAESQKILIDALETLRKFYKESKSFKTDFDEFLERTQEKALCRNDVKRHSKLKNLEKYISTGSAKDTILIIELIYLFRNMFYHTGESAKIGARNIRNRQKILELCYKTLADYMLTVCIHLLPQTSDGVTQSNSSSVR